MKWFIVRIEICAVKRIQGIRGGVTNSAYHQIATSNHSSPATSDAPSLHCFDAPTVSLFSVPVKNNKTEPNKTTDILCRLYPLHPKGLVLFLLDFFLFLISS